MRGHERDQLPWGEEPTQFVVGDDDGHDGAPLGRRRRSGQERGLEDRPRGGRHGKGLADGVVDGGEGVVGDRVGREVPRPEVGRRQRFARGCGALQDDHRHRGEGRGQRLGEQQDRRRGKERADRAPMPRDEEGDGAERLGDTCCVHALVMFGRAAEIPPVHRRDLHFP